jgi:hypothetical protein
MIATLTPIRERAQELRTRPERVLETLRSGAAKARAVARRTIGEVRRHMGFLDAGESHR